MLCFRLSVNTNPMQVGTEYRPRDKPYKVFCADSLAILCTSSYRSQMKGGKEDEREKNKEYDGKI